MAGTFRRESLGTGAAGFHILNEHQSSGKAHQPRSHSIAGIRWGGKKAVPDHVHGTPEGATCFPSQMWANSTWRSRPLGPGKLSGVPHHCSQNLCHVLFCLTAALPPSPAQPPVLCEEDMQPAGTASAVASALPPGPFLLLIEALHLHGQITGMRGWRTCPP